MSAPLSARIARFATEVEWHGLSPARRFKTGWILADFIASTLAGSTLPEAASGFALAQSGPVCLPGDSRGLSPQSAALAMGTIGALLQIHDGYGGGGNHPCSAIISALWASRRTDQPLSDLLLPIVVGYEVANRLAGASHPAQTLAGIAPTSTTGTVGAAAAAARLRGLNAAATQRAINIAAFSAPLAALRGLTEHGSVNPLHGGLAARAALDAVELAVAGLDAGATILDPVALLFGQPPRPAHELYDRLMSMPWAIASTLVHQKFGFDNVIARARDPRIEALYPRIRNRVDAEFAADYPRTFSTRVELIFTDGARRIGECRMEYGVPAEHGPYSPRGTTTKPLDGEGLARKFFDLACRRVSRGEAEQLLNKIVNLEQPV